ncbi:RNA polymerase, alpha subunit, C-terminal [uncultured Caudovirales phage]|uniref:RNA polymerase, alpha subunit, C-terminal n=1 Tax=uncultured Caudovirales phage TaxID=2100421 RepID=A0A6J5NZM6_9CAUD|nr:RNA polymerase, alpha subunit, C-terminal [uncultured Caudovirales phage]
MTLDDLDLTVRAANFLYGLGIKDIESLLLQSAGTLRKQRNCGEKTIKEIRERLAFHGLALCGDILVQSAAGIALVKEIPELIKRLQNQVHSLKSDIKDLSDALEKIRLSQE